MNIHDRKEITAQELAVGMKIESYKDLTTGMRCFSTLIVARIDEKEVVFTNRFGKESVVLKNPGNYIFERELTKNEHREKYADRTGEIVEALDNKLAQVEGYHEMWNTWLYAGGLSDIASELEANDMRIIGYSPLTVPKTPMFGGDILDIGVVAEYTDSGERFWCHASDNYRKELLGGVYE